MPSLGFVGQFKLFSIEILTGLAEEERNMDPAVYWRTKSATYHLLYKLGLWYASVPLSSVAAERAIALMHEIETPKRSRSRSGRRRTSSGTTSGSSRRTLTKRSRTSRCSRSPSTALPWWPQPPKPSPPPRMQRTLRRSRPFRTFRAGKVWKSMAGRV